MELRLLKRKVRIHLGFECSQFRVARENSCFHLALCRFLRLLDRQQDVEESDCKQIEQDSGTEEKRQILRKVRLKTH